MRRVLFRVLGSAHGIAGLVTLFIVFSVVRDVDELSPGPYKGLGITGGVLSVLGLIACGIASWRRPRIAPLFAWLAALAYILTAVLEGYLRFGAAAPNFVQVNFYYSGATRLLAALALTLLGGNIVERSNIRAVAP